MPDIWTLPLAFTVSLLVAGAVMRAGIMDHPNTRSSHSAPTPRGGGLGIVLGVLAALPFLSPTSPFEAAALMVIGTATLLAALLGLLDDLVTLSGALKFPLLAGLSLAVAATAGPVTELGLALPWVLGLAGSALWIFTTVNAVNFMDGSDGIMVASLVPACLALGLMADGAIGGASYALAAALAGFAVWNAPILRDRGRLFSGDVGSLGASMLFAGLALHWAAQGPAGSAWLAPLLILPLLGDVLLTLASRARAGRRLLTAHRAHAYQLLLRGGHSHAAVAGRWGLMSMACATLALIGHHGPEWSKIAVLVMGVAGYSVLHRRIRRQAAANGEDTTQ